MDKKKILTAAGLCALALSGFSITVFGQQWGKYILKDMGYSISCPKSWQVRDLSKTVSEDMITIVLPKNTARKKFRANIIVISYLREKSTPPLEKLYKANIKNMPLSPQFPDFELNKTYKIKTGGHDAYQAMFTYTHPRLKVKLRSTQIYIMTDNRVFIIQYAAPKATYKKYMDEVNEIVQSFQTA